MWVIRNKKYHNYYAQTLFDGTFHFVTDIRDSKKMRYLTAYNIVNKFKYPDNYEIIEVKKRIYKQGTHKSCKQK